MKKEQEGKMYIVKERNDLQLINYLKTISGCQISLTSYKKSGKRMMFGVLS